MTLRAKTVPLLVVGLSLFGLEASCARSPDASLDSPGFFAPELAPHGACIDTKCPSPLATCEGVPGLCTVNLKNDIDHCGACQTPCPQPPRRMHGSYLCDEGQCRFVCAPLWADCNGTPDARTPDADDGCETSIQDDPANCGACRKACEAGVVCWKGACGCPNGFTQCGNECKNLDSDNKNCGACGAICAAPTSDTDPRWSCGPGVAPPHTEWTCANSSCTLQCSPSYGDCNQNFCGDGCEVDLKDDPANCGACGRACAAGQTCRNGTCLCPVGTTGCFGQCVDLATDPDNCGDCGNGCPGPPSTSGAGSPACVGGKCSYVCFPGFADCDKRISNGCEANLVTSPLHCGGCNTRCDVKAGQPCVGGQCLTKPCEDAVVR